MQRAQPNGKQTQADGVHAPGLRGTEVGRIFNESRNHQNRHDSHGHVDVESPAPGVLIREPSTKGWAKDGCKHDAEANTAIAEKTRVK